ncbi:MAG: 4Fe-4S binding protein [Ruminiclostridium sp.]
MEKCKLEFDNLDSNQSVIGQETIDDKNKLLTDELKRFIVDISRGVALVGVASIDRFNGAPLGHGPRDFIPDANAVVVIGFPIAEGLVDHDRFMEGSEVIKEEDTYVGKDGVTRTWYPRRALRNHIERRGSHEIINSELQTLSIYGANFLEKAGFKSVYLPTTYGQTFSWPGNTNPDFPKTSFGPFSHRHAAVAAGLGEIGLNNLMLTPEYGPRNRFVSIITRAPLVADPLISKTICLGEKCSLCVKNCYGEAFGEVYNLNIGGHVSRLARINTDACMKGFEYCYKKCIAACPVGLRA